MGEGGMGGNGNVALSILRECNVTQLILRKSHVALSIL